MTIRPQARSTDFVTQESGDETLIYDLKSNKAFCLNETLTIIWKICDGNHTISEIEVEVEKQIKSRIDVNFIWFALDQLDKSGLLAKGFKQDDRFIGLSRREVIRKAGVGSMVALPILSSIVAPSALAAQSSACGVPIGVCLVGGTDICPTGCAGVTLNARNFFGVDVTCSGASIVAAPTVCGATLVVTVPVIIDSLS